MTPAETPNNPVVTSVIDSIADYVHQHATITHARQEFEVPLSDEAMGDLQDPAVLDELDLRLAHLYQGVDIRPEEAIVYVAMEERR